jgi:pimeloyl-ACP methyl ester carboxylesterase
MRDPDVTTANLAVPGATIYYKTQGHGPLLLILQGGDGNADASNVLAAGLTDHFTVVSYDRRGLTRSPADAPSAPVDPTTHADDAARLLAAVTDQPAAVFGTSLGALIGLALLGRHPEQVRLLVAHEPPVTELLAEPERSQAQRGREEVEATYRSEGVAAAMKKFVALAGLRFDDLEPGVTLPEPKPERLANLEFFLSHDAPAARRYRLDLSTLVPVADRVVPAAGRDTETFPRRCAEGLAARLQRPMIEFPGAHNGWLLHPREFSARLLQVVTEELDERPVDGRSPAQQEVRAVKGPLTVTFTRRPAQHDLVHVVRTDGTETEWGFPNRGDALPHDLVHFVVEQGIGLIDGFWGLIDDGVEVVISGDQVVLSRDGEPLREPAVDFSGLVKAEEAVALLGPKPALESVGALTIARLAPDSFIPPAPGDTRLPDGTTIETVNAIQTRLRELTQHWQQRQDQSITLTWHRGSNRQSPIR